MSHPVPNDVTEAERLAALHHAEVLDTLPEQVFDAITQAAAAACQVPISLVSLVDTDRQWFKSNIGLPGVTQTPRAVAFCDHAIRQRQVLEVPDAQRDARFAANPLVVGDPRIRFYAAAPIEMPGGARIGTVCVIDREPRALTDTQRAMLDGLGRVAAAVLRDRQRQLQLTRDLADSEARYRAIVEDQSELISVAEPDGTLRFVNRAYAEQLGVAPAQIEGRNLLEFVPPEERDRVREHLATVARDRVPLGGVNRLDFPGGAVRWISWINRPIVDGTGRVTALHSVGRDITAQRLVEMELVDAVREKETLLREVYHRVKNNLQIVQSLLNLQQRGLPDNAARQALADSARRVRAMALVHEKLYQSGNLASISLATYTAELLHQIDEASGAGLRGIALVADVDDIESGPDSAIPYALVVTELVFNALEHAFAWDRRGRVVVRLRHAAGDAPLLEVQDDGVGLPADFDLANTPSMGLQLAATLSQQLGGRLVATNGQGARFATELPRLVPG